jgi:predicted HTH domain antitoxin
MRLAAAVEWYAEGMVSQGKAAGIAGVSRAEFLDELARRRISASQATLDELRDEIRRG